MAAENSQKKEKDSNWLNRFVPLLQWMPNYERGWLRFDLIAGLTVAALVVPKALVCQVLPRAMHNDIDEIAR